MITTWDLNNTYTDNSGYDFNKLQQLYKWNCELQGDKDLFCLLACWGYQIQNPNPGLSIPKVHLLSRHHLPSITQTSLKLKEF